MPTAGVTSDHTGRRRPGMRAPESRGPDTRDDGDSLLIFDVFESREAFKQFGKTMGTLPQEVGITEGLKLFEVARRAGSGPCARVSRRLVGASWRARAGPVTRPRLGSWTLTAREPTPSPRRPPAIYSSSERPPRVPRTGGPRPSRKSRSRRQRSLAWEAAAVTRCQRPPSDPLGDAEGVDQRLSPEAG